jgi:hypothetical protein
MAGKRTARELTSIATSEDAQRAVIWNVSDKTAAYVSALLSGRRRWCMMKREVSSRKATKYMMGVPSVVLSGTCISYKSVYHRESAYSATNL